MRMLVQKLFVSTDWFVPSQSDVIDGRWPVLIFFH
jgi:hypothetical protein